MSESLHAIHGGRSFEAIGIDLQTLENRANVVDADVLDAWYEPAPGVVAAIHAHLPWLIKTSPPTHGDGLRQTIARTRGLNPDSVLLGAGTSSLIYLAFREWLRPESKVVVLDPTYGEYTHILESVIGAQVSRFELKAEENFVPNLEELAKYCRDADMVVIVNPNSPTGQCLRPKIFETILDAMKPDARLWVDETYIDFPIDLPTLEPLVARDKRLVVCKSMSKFYGLSGLRIGYLAMSPDEVRKLEVFNPPWGVGLIAQLAAIEALIDGAYYRARANETAELRTELMADLSQIHGLRVIPSETNFVMLEVAPGSSGRLVAACAERNVFIRDCDSLSPRFEGRFIRTAVKGRESNRRIVEEIAQSLRR